MLSWLELPLILGMLAVYATGLAMLLSAMFVYFRDIQPIWDVVPQIMFYASPVIIPIDHRAAFRHGLVHLYMLNPLAVVFQQFRHAMVTHATPSAGEVLGGGAAARAAGHRRRGVRARVLRVQPHGAVRGREPLKGPGARAVAAAQRVPPKSSSIAL